MSTKALLIVPANNTTMEPEIAALCPELDTILVARVRRPMRTLTADDMAGYGEATIEAAAPFVSERPEIVVHGCTAGGFLAGPEGNARIVAELERVMGAPVISTADAMVGALRYSGVRSTAVVTPYLPSVNKGLTRYVEAGGIEVETLSSFLCETTDALGAVTELPVWEKALATVTPQSRALFIACSQLPTLDIIVPLRERLGIPVWSSIRATAWAMARMLAASGRHLSLLGQEASASEDQALLLAFVVSTDGPVTVFSDGKRIAELKAASPPALPKTAERMAELIALRRAER